MESKEDPVTVGKVPVVDNLHGVETRRPKSISFASMEEDEFEKLYSDVLDVIIKTII